LAKPNGKTKNIYCTSCKKKYTISSLITIANCVHCGHPDIKLSYGKKHKFGARAKKADGINFPSQLEEHMYKMLKKFKIDFQYQVKFKIMDSCTYLGELVRPIHIIVDFIIDGEIVDTKGVQTPDNKIKHKMLKKKFSEEGENINIVLLTNQKEVNSYVLKRRSNSNLH